MVLVLLAWAAIVALIIIVWINYGWIAGIFAAIFLLLAVAIFDHIQES